MKRLRGVLEVLGEMRHRGATILVCPRCGKTNIYPERSVTLGFLPTIYICRECGYRGHLIAEADDEKPEKPY